MRITPNLISIPPYLSTTWKNVASLQAEERNGFYTLIITLQNQTQVEVPRLTRAVVEEIFEAQSRAAEAESPKPPILGGPFTFNVPIKSDGTLNMLSTAMQHDPEQKQLPPLPSDVLKKISAIAQVFGIDYTALARPEPGCNCAYCQMARALNPDAQEEESSAEEISAEDLQFRDWEIVQIEKELYQVTNPLDANERYNVFLGTPLGCTCGEKNCEHIQAVLRS